MPEKLIIGFGIGALIALTSGLGTSARAPGNICFIPILGPSNSGRRRKFCLSASVIVWVRFLTSPLNSEGITVGPALTTPATGACELDCVDCAKLSIPNDVPIRQSAAAVAMRGLKRPDSD